MSSMRKALAVSAALGALAFAGEASAAKAVARLITEPGSSTVIRPGEAIATVAGSNASASAAAYEYGGAIGVSASASGTGGGSRPGFAEAGADASLSDSFTVAMEDPNVFPTYDGFFTLIVPIQSTGSVSSINAPYAGNPGTFSLAGATYRYNYSVGGIVGGSTATSSKDFYGDNVEIVIGPLTHILTLQVAIGDVIGVGMSAHAGASGYGLPGAAADAVADFSHTLKWGGVTGITATDASGNSIALPDGFRLSLIGSNGFDYWNAAGRNPFTSTGVPEPATWAMMILGFAGVGAAVRRRRSPLAA